MPDYFRDPQSNRTIEFTITAGNVTIGTFVLVQDIWGILAGAEEGYGTMTMTIGAKGTVVYASHNITIPKATGTNCAIVRGDKLYFSATEKNVSATKAGTYTLICGVALDSATDDDARVLADMDMTLAFLSNP